RVAQREVDVAALHLGAIADADDVELAPEALADARHRVRDQRAREAMELVQLAVLAGVRVQLAIDQLEPDARGERLRERALRALHFDQAVLERDVHALRHRNRLLTNTRHESDPSVEPAAPYHTLRRISPPTPGCTASRPVVTPREVVRMAVPSPRSTTGALARPKHTRRPGRLTRSRPEITRSPRGPYFRAMRSSFCGESGAAGSSITLTPLM